MIWICAELIYKVLRSNYSVHLLIGDTSTLDQHSKTFMSKATGSTESMVLMAGRRTGEDKIEIENHKHGVIGLDQAK
jgi:hypothetical protein